MKRVIAAIITMVFLGVILYLSRGPAPPRDSATTVSPETCIEQMFTAAERGDVSAYLDCFTGAERNRLDRELADQSPDAFARSLRTALQELKGRAVFGPPEDQPSSSESVVTVERVYLNRTERQTYRMVREADRWRIAGVQSAQAYQPATAYGTPVFDMTEPAAGSGP